MPNIKYRTEIPEIPTQNSVKVEPLTHREMDGNFKSLSDAIDAIALQLSGLTFTPAQIQSINIDSSSSVIVETGSTKSNVVLTWTLTGATPTGQNINNGVGSIGIGTLNRTVVGPFTTSQSWTLTVTSTTPTGQTMTDTRTVNLNFRQKRYWGVSTLTTLNNSQILALNNEFATNNTKVVTYNATGGRYLYYAYPQSFGAVNNVTVNGLSFSDFTETITALTNSSGFSENYRVIRFNNIQNGAAITVDWK